jgi:hypothetical protein
MPRHDGHTRPRRGRHHVWMPAVHPLTGRLVLACGRKTCSAVWDRDGARPGSDCPVVKR